ncbi:MAG: ribulose-phosphate 3-epimerase, partial [Bacteroidetes bacterium]|nr:ribulose-phosphate 3-epimerase [Bacteroidota bacterium]
MGFLLAPSILSAEFTELGNAIRMINQSEADWIHVDVMDGVFVPNITIGIPVVKSIKKIAEKPLDVHLMIVHPEKYITDFKEAGADILTVQYEACDHLHRVVHMIKEAGMKAGVAINPHTPVNSLKDIIGDLDMVLLMSVNPGFGGQKFIEHSYQKIRELKNLISFAQAKTLIEIDGGVSLSNAAQLAEVGADI